MANTTIVIPLANNLYAGLMSPAQVGAIGSNPDTTNATNITLGNLVLPSTSIISVGNSTLNVTSNSTGVLIGAINATSVGLAITNTSITIGNSTVNTYLDDQSALITGNSTVNTTVNSTIITLGVIGIGGNAGISISNTSIMIGNSTVNTTANSTHFFSGNSTTFGWTNSTAEMFANSSGNNITTPLSIIFQTNSSANTILNSTSLILNTNGIYNASFTSNTLSIGTANSSANGTTLSNSSLTVGNTLVNTTLIASTLTFNANSSVNATVNATTYGFQTTTISPAVITRPAHSVLVAQRALVANSNTTPQSVFPAGQNTVTLAATTAYHIDAVYMVGNAGITVNNQMQVNFGNTQNLTAINYTVIGSVSNGGTYTLNSSSGALTTSVWGTTNAVLTCTPPCSGSTANASYTIVIKGTIITGASAPAITPQVAWTAACNATPQILTGSYISFTPLCNSSYGNSGFGTWA